MEKKMKIALIAHDRKKDDLIKFVKDNEGVFRDFDLVATRMTGMKLAKKTTLNVKCLESGARGGDQEIGAMIAKGEVDALLFFRDSLTMKATEPDMNTLPRLCDIHNIPYATNRKSGKGILAFITAGKSNQLSKINEPKFMIEDILVEDNKEVIEAFMPENNIEALMETVQKNAHQNIFDQEDPLTRDAIAYIYETQKASALLLQLKFKMTSTRAIKIIKDMEARGLIGVMEGNKPRQVLMSEDEYQDAIS